jgi:hypothetical protein
MSRSLKAVAIIAAHNEADIIAPVVGDLIEQGLSVYLIDHGSTDGTAQAVERFLGHGLLAIEPFPFDRFPAAKDTFAWSDILTRKTEVAATLDADWIIHHDADEFRESPWEHLRLIEAIERVDRLGYNAIDFEVYNFWPTTETFRPGDDPRPLFRFSEPGRAWDKLQVKCWKKGAPVDLVTSGGHDVMFEGREVFPLRFLLRHYPIRSQEHGARKVFRERRPRLLPQEVAQSWHLQYAPYVEGQSFLRDPNTLTEYNGEVARLALVLNNRYAEECEKLLDQTQATLVGVQSERANFIRDIETQRRELEALYASRSWRWTSSLRAVQRMITGK